VSILITEQKLKYLLGTNNKGIGSFIAERL